MLYKENKNILIGRELRKTEFETQQQCFGCRIPFAVHLLVSWHLWGKQGLLWGAEGEHNTRQHLTAGRKELSWRKDGLGKETREHRLALLSSLRKGMYHQAGANENAFLPWKLAFKKRYGLEGKGES